ncbi:MAG: tRNA pseudouridine(38-40) synthase TruA [Archangium gephyra]|uniref:tRNA pseudouridine synthase A n=1 Tax=Archangium gephyra TaxID=48 RepID=A0A2W5V628_9BACT|nr:MAG: tRNA pseudouridine(38-40) synthase TruA [Archangium gephyra]
MSPDFHIVAFWCWYRGQNFHGFQQQGTLRTVQAELLRAFPEVGLERNPVVAGRTDRGVSARMQVLSGRVDKRTDLSSLPARINAALPDDMGIHLAKASAPKFNAAWSASEKEYRYVVTEPGDLTKLMDAASLIPGTRDFRVFHFKTSQLKPRTVTSVELLEGNVLRFTGEGFARFMVRMLVGGMLAVSRGEVSIDVFRAGLEQQQNFHCPKAPPEALTLWSVGYPPDIDPFSADERASFQWRIAAHKNDDNPGA